MKGISLLAVALQGVHAFPGALNAITQRATVGQSGCSTSAQCNKNYPVSNTDINYDPNNPTAAQKASAAVSNCGVACPCLTFDPVEQKGQAPIVLIICGHADDLYNSIHNWPIRLCLSSC
jgi:hypothetical protein